MSLLDSKDPIPAALKDLTPLDPMDVSKLQLLYNLQGNILKGHGRDHTTHIFISFKEAQKEAARKWLKEFAKEYVTCFQKQLKERELFKRNGTPGGLFASVFITKKGYEYLGLGPIQEKPDAGFEAGMKHRHEVTYDPPVSEWEEGFKEEIHVMILLADDDLTRMGETAVKLLKGEPDKKLPTNLTEISEVRAIEYGHVIRNANGDGIEHFGYVDGVSQPLFLKDEVDNYKSFHNIKREKGDSHNTNEKDSIRGNELKFNPSARADLVLIPDPYAPDASAPDCQSFGSYFVFRKLEQNVRDFKEAEEAIGKELFQDEKDEDKRELAGAYLVGRFEDGTPSLISDTDGLIGSGNFNNFNYDQDPSGGRCPHFAHIRKTNPRVDATKPDAAPMNHMMARRGIPFGHRAIDTALGIDPSPYQMPTGGVGLLFMSYQASIVGQFETIQRNFANDPNFPLEKNTGIDPIIGQKEDQDHHRSYRFPEAYDNGEPREKPSDFKQFVTMKGGEYFFAPSMSFFRSL